MNARVSRILPPSPLAVALVKESSIAATRGEPFLLGEEPSSPSPFFWEWAADLGDYCLFKKSEPSGLCCIQEQRAVHRDVLCCLVRV